MKPLIRRLARVRHAVYGALAQGVLTLLVGLYFQAQHAHGMQDNPLMTPAAFVGLGVTAIVLATTAVIATHVVDPVLEGEIVELQQPQLPDVQTHTRCTPELSQVA